MMINLPVYLAVIGLVMSSLTGCVAQTKAVTNPPLATPSITAPPLVIQQPSTAIEHTWHVVAINSTSTHNATLSFYDNGQGSAYAGCNRIRFSYRIDGQKLAIGQIFSTKKACPEMATEHLLLRHLPHITTYTVSDNLLTLVGNDSRIVSQQNSYRQPSL